jgi:hypothetical protein
VIGLEKWDLYMNLWRIKFCESNLDPIKSQIEGSSFNGGRAPRAKTTTSITTTLNTECLRTQTFRAKQVELGFDEFNSWVASNKTTHKDMNRLPT